MVGETRYLKVGDWVRVRSRPDILSTLDQFGAVAGLPFMAEMERFAGRVCELCAE